jgi:type VI secretion system protein ImpM
VTGKVWHCPLAESLNWLNATPALASNLLKRAFTRPSLWWTEGSDRINRCLLICEGLPPIEGFAALLAGDWPQRGWNEKPLADIAGLDEPSVAEEASS